MPDTNMNPNVEIPATVEVPIVTTNSNDGLLFSASDVAKARQDEKTKLYAQLEKAKAELLKSEEKLRNVLLNGTDKDSAIKEKDSLISELEAKVKKLEDKGARTVENDKSVKDLEKKIAELEKTLADKEIEISTKELEGYKKEKIQSLDESVSDLVTGSTKEEIDASIEKAKALYEKISSKLGKVAPTTTAPNIPPVVPKPNVADHDEIFKDTKVEDIMNMDITTPEGRKRWEDMRGNLGLTNKNRYKR